MRVMNQPLRHGSRQGVFPLWRSHGPVGVVELAEYLGRDYTTVGQVKNWKTQGTRL
ncbi:hypothetical protein ACB264_04815 [Klebsiella pneumoniae]